MKYKVGDKIPVSAIVEITGISITKNDKAVYSTDHGFAVCENVLEQISIKGREKPVMPEPTPKINWGESEPKKQDKPVFDWDDFMAGKIAVHCGGDHEKAKDFLAKCHEHVS